MSKRDKLLGFPCVFHKWMGQYIHLLLFPYDHGRESETFLASASHQFFFRKPPHDNANGIEGEYEMASGQSLVALVNIKIAGEWVFTPLTLIIIIIIMIIIVIIITIISQ